MRTVLVAAAAALVLAGCTKYADENQPAASPSPASARAHVACGAVYPVVSAPGDGHMDTVAIVGTRTPVKTTGSAEVGRDPQLEISGWATTADKTAVSALCPIVDGKVVPGGDIGMDLPRPDVAAVGQAAPPATVGYRGIVALKGLTPGKHRFAIGRVTPKGVAALPETLTLIVR